MMFELKYGLFDGFSNPKMFLNFVNSHYICTPCGFAFVF